MTTQERAPVTAQDHDAFRRLMDMPPEKRKIANMLICAIDATQSALTPAKRPTTHTPAT